MRILYDRRPLLVTASSKILSKEYVLSKSVPALSVPSTYWQGTDLGEIHGASFPSGWVLKPSHRSGGVTVSSSSTFDVNELEFSPRELLREREYRTSKLWAYREGPRALILEERLGDAKSPPTDYKFFVFCGRVKMIQVDSGRFGTHARVLYTPEWVPRPECFGVRRGSPEPRPQGLDEMIRISESLGSEFDFVRVDLYYVDGSVFFGELTVYPGGGLSPWPVSLDAELGSEWELPSSLRSRKSLSDSIVSLRRFLC